MPKSPRCYCQAAFYDRDILPKENLIWQLETRLWCSHSHWYVLFIYVQVCCESNSATPLSVNRTISLSLIYLQKWDRFQVFACVQSLDKKIVKYLFIYRNSCHHMPTGNKSWRVHTEKKSNYYQICLLLCIWSCWGGVSFHSLRKPRLYRHCSHD